MMTDGDKIIGLKRILNLLNDKTLTSGSGMWWFKSVDKHIKSTVYTTHSDGFQYTITDGFTDPASGRFYRIDIQNIERMTMITVIVMAGMKLIIPVNNLIEKIQRQEIYNEESLVSDALQSLLRKE